MPYQWIIFDFGRVLGESNLDRVAKDVEHKLQITHAQAVALVHGYKQRDCSKEEFWRRSDLVLPGDWLEWFEECRCLHIEKNEEMFAFVHQLREEGYQLAVLSNTTPQRASHIKALGLYQPFSPVVLSCEIGIKKPDPKAFQILLNTLHAQPEQCIFIDDSKENVKVASQLGFEAILFESPASLKEALRKRISSAIEG